MEKYIFFAYFSNEIKQKTFLNNLYKVFSVFEVRTTTKWEKHFWQYATDEGEEKKNTCLPENRHAKRSKEDTMNKKCSHKIAKFRLNFISHTICLAFYDFIQF